ncbi:MAG: pyridoxamine 5'-phosphate oxidase family protein, partial [Clostridia bacterium]|nr:pyridoxamine 5'-phosphate oxidase family protein [Clostridia bacterium]
EFWFVSEGGNKFIGLEKNRNVSMAIFEYYGDVRDSHGLQVMGTVVFYDNQSDEFKKLLAFKGIPYDVMKAAAVEVAVIRVKPYLYEMYDTDFVKAGYDVRQIVRLDEE